MRFLSMIKHCSNGWNNSKSEYKISSILVLKRSVNWVEIYSFYYYTHNVTYHFLTTSSISGLWICVDTRSIFCDMLTSPVLHFSSSVFKRNSAQVVALTAKFSSPLTSFVRRCKRRTSLCASAAAQLVTRSTK